MNVEQVKAEIVKIPQLKDFNWRPTNDSNTYATFEVGNKTFKDKDKSEYRLGSFYSLFIAHMYKGEKGKEFFYIILCRNSEVRKFRKHNFEKIEYNKIFASGNTIKKVVDDLKGYFKNGYELL